MNNILTICEHLLKIWSSFSGDQRGATAVEYGLMLAGIALFIMVTVFALGDELNNMFQAVQTKLANAYT